MKKIFILILVVLIIGVGYYLLKPKEIKKEKKELIQTNEKLTEDQVIDNILISNISLVTKENSTTFSAKLTNLTANKVEYKNLQIIIKSKNKELASLICYFGGDLGPEETRIVTSETNSDLKNIDQIEFKLQK